MSNIPSKTDLSRWRLSSGGGNHRWNYIDSNGACTRDQRDYERYCLGVPLLDVDVDHGENEPQPNQRSFQDSARTGLRFFTRLQLPEGHWACDYGGPSFLLPGLIFAMYIADQPVPDGWKTEMVRYLANHVNEDGGWGLHLEGKSTVFATGLYYVMLRLLGIPRNDLLARRARDCLLSLGGATGVPQWGKIWLACLNLYSWDGVNCIPADLWLLPTWVPFHPSRWWVQCRVVYLPTSYLWSNRCTKPLTPLLAEIRNEIYTKPFDKIKFADHRNDTAPTDSIRSVSPLLLFLFFIVGIWCRYLQPRWYHTLSNRRVSELMRMEEHNTEYECLAPVNKAFHMAVAWFEDGPDSNRLRRHIEKVSLYLWMGPQGMTSNGTDGVQVWDTAFAIQAALPVAEFAESSKFVEALHKAHCFLDNSQLREDLDDPFRQPGKGGWPFSTKSNGFIVSDCSAESLKAVLMLQNEHSYPSRIEDQRLKDCVDTLLKMGNNDGGFASYEKIRGSKYLELLNPAEVFDNIMVEYSYTECTSAVVTALHLFHRHFPDYRAKEIHQISRRAYKFIRRQQRPDGSWYGSWAICFNYGTLFALQALETAGEQWDASPRVKKACGFILSQQMDDGGWGEDSSSCTERQYVQNETSQVVSTSWAVLALMHAGYPDPTPIQRGLQLIQSRQQANGEWLQEAIEGVFNRTCMIGYPNYKFYFPIMALGAYDSMYLPKMKAGLPKPNAL
ncbi:lanosterol synthase [Pochonia chlamydosporia 170]|uniref:Terpene cyclase/mutase family member n=1 Tax=Pochonia chlamydosporia 170 TaxID=1380566 RepID=A0A179F3A5_METCM|nr:lanosterol synthase [Pochonia chlamydosporia 170]OAQ59653.1 lanosterol synthase [Pochonia chlamydosporia 170]